MENGDFYISDLNLFCFNGKSVVFTWAWCCSDFLVLFVLDLLVRFKFVRSRLHLI
jgi:hypothetical protein